MVKRHIVTNQTYRRTEKSKNSTNSNWVSVVDYGPIPVIERPGSPQWVRRVIIIMLMVKVTGTSTIRWLFFWIRQAISFFLPNSNIMSILVSFFIP